MTNFFLVKVTPIQNCLQIKFWYFILYFLILFLLKFKVLSFRLQEIIIILIIIINFMMHLGIFRLNYNFFCLHNLHLHLRNSIFMEYFKKQYCNFFSNILAFNKNHNLFLTVKIFFISFLFFDFFFYLNFFLTFVIIN